MIKLISLIPIFLFNSPTYFDQGEDAIFWSEKRITFDDFKGKILKKDSKPNGEISLKISWTKSGLDHEVPHYTVYNKMMRNDSWISIKHQGLLREYQLYWDIQELYVRKIRKDLEELENRKEKNRDLYTAKITKNLSVLQKSKQKYKGVFVDQDDLYRIVNNQYQDSLKMYDKYKAK